MGNMNMYAGNAGRTPHLGQFADSLKNMQPLAAHVAGDVAPRFLDHRAKLV